MPKGNKTICNNSVMRIATLKNNIRNSSNPFDGTGHIFKEAIKQLRKEGVAIIYDAVKCRYYNPVTIHPKWGY